MNLEFRTDWSMLWVFPRILLSRTFESSISFLFWTLVWDSERATGSMSTRGNAWFKYKFWRSGDFSLTFLGACGYLSDLAAWAIPTLGIQMPYTLGTHRFWTGFVLIIGPLHLESKFLQSTVTPPKQPAP